MGLRGLYKEDVTEPVEAGWKPYKPKSEDFDLFRAMQVGTGKTPTIRGTTKGVGLYAGEETEPLYHGDTGKPYYVASAPTTATDGVPSPETSPAAWAKEQYAKMQEDNAKIMDEYNKNLSRRQQIIDIGVRNKAPWEVIEKGLKMKSLDNIKEPKEKSLPADIIKMIEGEKKKTDMAAAETKETSEGIFQWNPSTSRYDIFVGKSKKAAEDTLTKQNVAAQRKIETANVAIHKVDEALADVGFFTTGMVGSALSNIKGTGAYDLNQVADTIKANIGFDTLQAMREASPTGGALGQIAVRELDFLQATLGSLAIGQSKEKLIKNLQAVKKHYNNWKNIYEQAQNQIMAEEGAVGGVPETPAPSDGGWSIERVQ